MNTLKLSLRQLEVFLKAAELGSVSAAADALGISQPQVSRTLGEIEKKLGTDVFFRTPEGLELTPTGRLLLNFARQTLELASKTEYAIHEQRGVPACPLFVATTPDLLPLASQALAHFQQEYPHLPLHVESQNADAVLDRLTRQRVSIALLSAPNELLPQGLLTHDLGTHPWGLLVPAEHQETPIEKLPVVLPPEGSLEYRTLAHFFDVLPPAIHHASGIAALCALAQTGFAAPLPLTCTSQGLVAHATSRRLEIPRKAVQLERGLHPVSSRAFLRLLKAVLTEKPPPQEKR